MANLFIDLHQVYMISKRILSMYKFLNEIVLMVPSIAIHCLHTVKGFYLLQSNTNNSFNIICFHIVKWFPVND